MKKRFKRKSLSVRPQDEPGVADLINKVQQQLSAMEKKLDILINQSSKKPFDHSYRHERGRQGHGHRERTYTRVICADCNKECEIPFKPSAGRPVYCKECFSKRKTGNPFNANRDNRPTEKRQKPAKKKKSFFSRRKKRT